MRQLLLRRRRSCSCAAAAARCLGRHTGSFLVWVRDSKRPWVKSPVTPSEHPNSPTKIGSKMDLKWRKPPNGTIGFDPQPNGHWAPQKRISHWIHFGFFKRTAAWNTTKHSLFAKTSTGLLQFCSQMMTFDNAFRRWKLSIASSLAVSHMPFPLEMQFDEWNMGTIWTFEVPLNSDHPNPVRNRPESETNTRSLSLRQTRGDPKMAGVTCFS